MTMGCVISKNYHKEHSLGNNPNHNPNPDRNPNPNHNHNPKSNPEH